MTSLPYQPTFTERFWHLSKYFCALADCQHNYLNTMITRDVAPCRIYQNYDPSTFSLVFPSNTNGCNNQTHQFNRTNILHAKHNYLFLQHHFRWTNLLVQKTRFEYVSTKLTSPYYMNYSYIINPTYCEGTLRNFDPIKSYFLFFPLYAKTHRPILVTIEYLQCVERGAKKCMYGHTFNLLNRDWMADKLVNREPTPEETQILNHLFALQPHCNTDLYPVHFLPISQKTRNFRDFSGILRVGPLTSNLNSGRRPQSYDIEEADCWGSASSLCESACSSLRESQKGTLTGLKLLTSTPCSWHFQRFHNRDDFLTKLVNTLLTVT